MSKENAAGSESFPERLKLSCRGLNFMSETDSEVVSVFGEVGRSSSTADILSAVGVSPTKTVETVDAKKFFSRLIKKKNWFTDAQIENANRFRALKSLLDSELTDLKVFRVGKIRLTYYVLGRDREGNVTGVKMDAIET